MGARRQERERVMGVPEIEGFNAYYPSGAPHLICPHPIGSRERDKWVKGWHTAVEAARIAAAMRKLRMAGPGAELADAVKELIEAMLEARQ
jgi:ribosome modulation factor